MPDSQFPYVAQFGSPSLIDAFLGGSLALCDDPAWQATGAPDIGAYEKWARIWCGMACLKSILGFVESAHASKTLHELAQLSVSYGGYVQEHDDRISGLFYKPFAEMAAAELGLNVSVAAPLDLAAVCHQVQSGNPVICSVHNTIRAITTPPPARGGHLVLVTRVETAGDVPALTFHNPSGSPDGGQADVVLELDVFEPYFAGRGLIINLEANLDVEHPA